MSEPPLTLTLRVPTRAQALSVASERAAKWFEVPERCVAASIDMIEPFSADLYTVITVATVSHSIECPTYGPPKCKFCGKEFWPHG